MQKALHLERITPFPQFNSATSKQCEAIVSMGTMRLNSEPHASYSLKHFAAFLLKPEIPTEKDRSPPTTFVSLSILLLLTLLAKGIFVLTLYAVEAMGYELPSN